MSKDLKFRLWITIQKSSHDNSDDATWSINWSFLDTTIYDREFFVEGYPITESKEDGKSFFSQTFTFNKILRNKIGCLLLPNAGSRNYTLVPQSVAWDYWNYLTYLKFTSNVHPVSVSNGFFRMEYEGTQEQIYNKCLLLHNRWIRNNKNLI